MLACVRLGEDGDLQAVLMMAVGRDRGRHGHGSGSHDGCARPRAVWAAAWPHRAALKRRVQKFRFVIQLRLQQAVCVISCAETQSLAQRRDTGVTTSKCLRGRDVVFD